MLGWKVIPRIGIGPVQFSPHGVGIAFGCLVGAWLLARRCRANEIDENHAWNTAAWGVVGAILGARIAYVIGHYSSYTSPVQWVEIWKGGISLVGGLLGGTLLAWLYFRRNHLDFWQFADLGAPGLAIGIALGRSGDLVIGDHLGRPTHFFLGWVYKGGTLISPPPCLTPAGAHVYPSPSGCIVPGMEVYQTALYDAMWCLCIFGILSYLGLKPRKKGLLFLVWAGLYAAGRIATDFLRVDKRWLGLGLTGSQITSIFVVALVAYLIIRYQGAPPSRKSSGSGGTTRIEATPLPTASSDVPAAELEPVGTVRVLVADEPEPDGSPPDSESLFLPDEPDPPLSDKPAENPAPEE